MNRAFPLLFLVVGAGGCTVTATSSSHPSSSTPPPTSSTLATSQMWASMSAQSDGQTLRIYAALLDGSSFVSLDTGDLLTASIGGNDVVLVREPNDAPGDVHYTAALPAPAAETAVTIALTRPTGRISAPSSQVTVASGFSITSSPPLAIHRGDLLSVTISPVPVLHAGSAQDRMTIAFSGPCVADQPPFFVNSDTSGTLRLDTSALQLVKGMTGCAVNVQVRHETDGAADPAYASGGDGVEGLQARSFATTLE